MCDSKVTFSLASAFEIRASDKDPLMAFAEEIGSGRACDEPGDGLEVSSSLRCLGSIALSPRPDLGLTVVLGRLALVSSASVTISRKLYFILH